MVYFLPINHGLFIEIIEDIFRTSRIFYPHRFCLAIICVCVKGSCPIRTHTSVLSKRRVVGHQETFVEG